MEQKSTRYEIVIGKKAQDGLQCRLVCGHAFLNEGESFYVIKLMMFPGQTYYLVKNRGSQDRYTVYAKMSGREEEIRLQNPVGNGRLSADLTAYLELYFPVLKTQMFMSLYPKEA